MTAPETVRRAYPSGAAITQVPSRDGWPLRLFDWPASGARGSILWLGGRGDIVEKYLEALTQWHDAGWGTTSFDWRGQGGSGRMLPDRHIGHVTDFAPWIDDLAEFWTAWKARTPGPHVLMGHSMGGHLVLRALAENRIDPDAVVLSAPMLGFDVPGPLRTIAPRVAALLGRTMPHRLAWKENEKPGADKVPRHVFLTWDADRYDDEMWWQKTDPSLVLGPPSWAWVAAAYRSVAALDKPGVVEGITAPVLLVGTDGDELVSPAAIRRYAARLTNSELLMFDHSAAHEVLREVDAVRDVGMARIADFLDRKAPAV